MRNNMTEMIQHVAKLHNAGVSMDAIAERRGVSVRTVAGYISRAKTAGLVSTLSLHDALPTRKSVV